MTGDAAGGASKILPLVLVALFTLHSLRARATIKSYIEAQSYPIFPRYQPDAVLRLRTWHSP